MRILTVLIMLSLLTGCAGLNFGYKDPEAGVEVTCVTEADVTNCSYIGEDGKEVSVEAPVVGADVEPK